MIKRLLQLTVVMALAAIPLVASATSIFDLYSHDAHNERYEAAGVKCSLCHQNDKSYNKLQVNLQGCHKCHNNPKAPYPGPNDCSMCHNKTIDPIKPRNHNASWKRIHGAFATQDSQKCNMCHSPNFCTDCHQQRDTIRQTMHPRNFKFVHSIEARANPARCDTCHTVTFCTNCHTAKAIP